MVRRPRGHHHTRKSGRQLGGERRLAEGLRRPAPDQVADAGADAGEERAPADVDQGDPRRPDLQRRLVGEVVGGVGEGAQEGAGARGLAQARVLVGQDRQHDARPGRTSGRRRRPPAGSACRPARSPASGDRPSPGEGQVDGVQRREDHARAQVGDQVLQHCPPRLDPARPASAGSG